MGVTRVNGQDVRDQGINTVDIKDDAVTTAKILNANVTNVKLDTTGVSAGTYSISSLVINAQGRVTSATEILTTKGDLISFGTSAARLGVGSDGTVLIADSTQTLGIKWLLQSATAPVSYSSATGNFSLAGMSSLGAANQVVSVNASATGWEYKTISGTTNRLSVSQGVGTVTLDIDTAYIGQTSITTLGTITTGTWNGTKVSEIYGGTNQSSYTLGDTLYSSAVNTLSKLAGNITTTRKFLRQVGNGTISAAPVWDTIVDADLPATLVRTSVTISTTSPLSGGGDLSANRTLTVGGLSSLGTANYIVGVNSGATAWEYKQVLGTTNRLSITHAVNSVTFDISTNYVGQATITTLGTITTGTWHGSVVAEIYGGTNQSSYTLGDTLYASAANTLSKLAGNTTTTKKFLRQTGNGTVSAAPAWDTLVAGDIPALAYVTSVALSLPSFITVSGSPVTSSGTLTGTLAVQAVNTVFSGPSSGGSAAPTFRLLVAADIPNLDTSKLTTGILPIARGGTNSGTALSNNRIMISSGGSIVESSAFTTGSVIFASSTGLPTQDNANFFYDTANDRLGLLNTSPVSTLSIGSTSQFQINSTGDIVKINDIAYSWPTAQGSNNYVLTNDGSGNLVWESGSSTSNIGFISTFDDFLALVLHDHSPFSFQLTSLNGGTGALETGAPVNNSYSGLVNITTGTTNNATGKTVLEGGSGTSKIKAGGGDQTIELRVRIPTLSAASPRFIARFGLLDSSAVGLPANGVFFSYTDNVNSGIWQGITRNASTSTTVNSAGSAVAAATWYKLRIKISAAGDLVEFFVDDVSFGTSSTNIPTGNAMRVMVSIEKGSTSTTSRSLDIDWAKYGVSR